jgi:hypothetical protein
MKRALPFLAVAFSGFLVYLFDKIWGNSIDWEKVKTVKIGEFLTAQVSIYQILIFLIFATAIFLLGRKFIGNKSQYYSKKQRKLRSLNKTEIPEEGILLRWKVFFDYDTPFIADLTAFCTRHDGPPMRFIHKRCPVQGCDNSRSPFNEFDMKNAIESDLIDKWEKIN